VETGLRVNRKNEKLGYMSLTSAELLDEWIQRDERSVNFS
jgi:hypothetical protein